MRSLSGVIRSVIFVAMVWMSLALAAQQTVPLFVDGLARGNLTYSDSAKRPFAVRYILGTYWQQGYFFAGIDSITSKGVFLHRGEKPDQSAAWRGVRKSANQALDEATNTGYPFALLVWQPPTVDQGLDFSIDKGPYTENDSLVLLSPVKTKPKFISRTLGIEKGTPYSERDFQSIANRLQRIPFLTLNRPADVSFQGKTAWTYLDLTEGTTGSFQGILGMLPGQSGTGEVLFTGNLDLELQNLFRSGKELDFHWAKFAEQSQRLDIRYRHPLVAGTVWTVEADLHLFRQDTSFVNQQLGLSAGFFLGGHTELSFGFQRLNANIIATQTDRIVANNWLDFQQDWYSLRVRRGRGPVLKAGNSFRIEGQGAVGSRRIRINPALPPQVYDTATTNLINYRLMADAEVQRGISGASYLYSRLSIGHLAGSDVSANQAFRLGGLQSLRGFNEQFFFANTYLVARTEWRLFFEEQSYFFAFYDQGFLRLDQWDQPWGGGLGFSLFTKSGLFSFAMAVGRAENVPLDLASMKIHFGYLSRF